MANLQLTLVTNQPGQSNSSCCFTERGGSIGRSQECDWTLNDAERFISNKHIIIAFVNGQFLLTDTSSNGTYINDNPAPLGKGNTHTLKPNDKIKIGTLIAEVTVMDLSPAHSQNSPAPENDLMALISAPSAAQPAAPVRHHQLPESSPQAAGTSHLGLFDILTGDSEPSSPQASPDSAAPKSRQSDDAMSASPFAVKSNGNTIPDNWDTDDDETAPGTASLAPSGTQHTTAAATGNQAPVSPASIPDQAAASTNQQADTESIPSPAPFSQDTQSEQSHRPETSNFFEILYAKLGLPKESMATLDQQAFADDLGQILMTSTQGLMALLAGRSVLKQESRLSMTMIKPQSNNPIKFSLDPSDILEMLLVKKKPGYLSAQAAYAEVMHDLQMHQMAFLAGYQASLKGILDKLSPVAIEQEASEKNRAMMDFKGHIRKWDTFVSKQQQLQKQVDENLDETLSEHFSAAYEDYINNAKRDS